jgi:hypothetical protein
MSFISHRHRLALLDPERPASAHRHEKFFPVSTFGHRLRILAVLEAVFHRMGGAAPRNVDLIAAMGNCSEKSQKRYSA